jgi:hypothetical protein
MCPFPHLAARIIWRPLSHAVAAAYARATVSELQIREVVSEARELDEQSRNKWQNSFRNQYHFFSPHNNNCFGGRE